MSHRNLFPLPITDKALNGLSRAISAQEEGWHTDAGRDVYKSQGRAGVLVARRTDRHNPSSFSIDLFEPDGNLIGVSYRTPDYPTDQPAHITAFHEAEDGQLRMTFGSEARQIFGAIQVAFVANQSQKQK